MTHSIRQIQHMGHRVYAVDGNPNAPGFALTDGHAPIDLGDADGIEAYARDIGADAVLAANEAGVLAAAIASERLGLRNLPVAVAWRALDKGLMRETWAQHQLPQPDFIIVAQLDAVPAAAAQLGYPVILKPTRNWGSRGISRADSPDDLAWSMAHAQRFQRGGSRFIVERFIDGIEVMLDGLVQDGRVQVLAKSDKVMQAHPRYRVTMHINYPPDLAAAQLERVDALAAQAVRALRIENGAFHAELFVTDDDIYLIEMAGRPGGGHIFGQVVEATSGVCMPQALTQILLGEPAALQPAYQRGASYWFFAPPPGVFIAAHGIEAARAVPGVLDFGFSMEPGTRVQSIEHGAARPGYCVTQGATRAEAMHIAAQAVGMMRYEMQSSAPEAGHAR